MLHQPSESIQNPWLARHNDAVSPMNRLFAELKIIYQNRWVSQFKSKEEMLHWANTWAAAFVRENIEPKDIALALEKCLSIEWPPALPEFLSLCRMNPERAFYEALEGLIQRQKGNRGKWSHRAIFWAAATMSSEILSGSYSQLKVRWERALAQAYDGPCNEIPDPALALPAPGEGVTSHDDALQKLSEIKPAIAVKSVDHKAWAKKILANPKGRPLIVVSMAKRALGVSDHCDVGVVA